MQSPIYRLSATQSVLVEFSILVAIGSKAILRIVVPFVCKPDSNSIRIKRPKFFNQPTFQFLCPLALKERKDFGSAVYEFSPVSPT